MLIHKQNLCAPCGKQHTSRYEVQSHELINKFKKKSLYNSCDVHVFYLVNWYHF
jgi:hypothetical protein